MTTQTYHIPEAYYILRLNKEYFSVGNGQEELSEVLDRFEVVDLLRRYLTEPKVVKAQDAMYSYMHLKLETDSRRAYASLRPFGVSIDPDEHRRPYYAKSLMHDAKHAKDSV